VKKLTDEGHQRASFKAHLDRVEGGLAIIVPSAGKGDQFEIPLSRLPRGVKAGDHLVISIQFDQESTEASHNRIGELLKDVEQTDDSDATGFKI